MQNLPIIFVVNGHQPFVYHHDGEPTDSEYQFFKSLSDIYLPMLRMFAKLEKDAVPFKLALCISPQLCSMMCDESLCARYVKFLDWQASFIASEKYRCAADDNKILLLDSYLADNQQNRMDFVDVYGQRILGKLKYYATRGCIEFLGTAASNAFLPLYEDMPEVLGAQIEIGLQMHRNFFQSTPTGFWLPYLGYSSGLEFALKNYGYEYTVLAGHGLLFGNPTPENGVFSPINMVNKFVAWGTDSLAVSDITDLESGYSVKGVYRNEERDVLFELPSELLPLTDADATACSRHYSGVKYWNNDGTVYDRTAAARQACCDAQSYLSKRFEKLRQATQYMKNGNTPASVCAISAEILGGSWHEGLVWLESLFRALNSNSYADDSFVLEVALPYAQIEKTPERQRVSPLMSSSADNGYAEDWLDSSNEWMCRFSRAAANNMVDLATRFCSDSGLKERALNLAARELLLAQDGDLPLMVKNMMYADSALARFESNIASFSIVYDFLGANTMSTEWLTDVERRHNIFEKVNFRIFKAKDETR